MLNAPLIVPADWSRACEFLGFMMDWKVTAEHTGGAFSAVEMTGLAGNGPPLHYHERADEFFFIVDGTMTFKVGEAIKAIGNGGFVWIPRQVVHSFRIDSHEARFLFGYVPAGVEQMFIEASSAADQSAERPAPNRERHGTVIAGPQLGEWLRQQRAQAPGLVESR